MWSLHVWPRGALHRVAEREEPPLSPLTGGWIWGIFTGGRFLDVPLDRGWMVEIYFREWWN